ncbi:hypothetical protein [Hallella mizrahii]|jgi:hypothetical protein|uniref:Uracil DNA glycosylase superfamily protein n=1 Tax=Hallella mizrahii TaxID=2606637 RepID=A0A7K0KFN8_9BACT|nr:hypothetical protein [Hallella mizrahii]MST84756.1 hypothetical protein [Hallella mizrahii]
MTVNEVLCNAYEPRFNNLLEHLEKDGIKSQVQPPFLLGIERFTEEGNKTGNEEWYTNANLKVMFFGRETHIWGWDEESSVSDGCVEQYEKFYGRNYREVNDGNKRGVFFLVDSEDKLSKTPFFATGLNGIMSGIEERLKEVCPDKHAVYLWNNISKLSSANGTSASTTAHEYEKKYFHVIPSEINILKPDVIIFFTGFDAKYDEYINENFNDESGYPLIGSETLQGVDESDVVKLNIKGIPLAYKTHHPQTTHVNNKTIDGAERWKHYNAILDDIKAHLGEIIK